MQSLKVELAGSALVVGAILGISGSKPVATTVAGAAAIAVSGPVRRGGAGLVLLAAIAAAAGFALVGAAPAALRSAAVVGSRAILHVARSRGQALRALAAIATASTAIAATGGFQRECEEQGSSDYHQ